MTIAEAIVQLDGLQPDPEIAPRDPAWVSSLPAIRPTVALGITEDVAPPDRHAKGFARDTEGQTALVAGGQPHVEFDPRVDLAAAKAAPAAAGQRHRAERRGGHAVLGAVTTTESEPSSGITAESLIGAMSLALTLSSAISVV